MNAARTGLAATAPQTLPDDLELERIPSEIEDDESTPTEYEIAVYPADFTLEVLNQKWAKDEMTIPKFQRGFVWSKSQSSRLIESFMMGLPVPQIFLYTDSEQKYLIVDGQQRLRTIFYFFEGYFGEPDARGRRAVFRLEGINGLSRWFKKTYNDFDEADKRKLQNSVLRAIIIKQLNPEDDTSIYHVFERLNTGGTPLKDQEVRNCVYGGGLNDLMIELNAYPAWRRILGKPKTDSRQKDVELILRYMALFHWSQQYRKPMKDFLSKYMNKHRHPSPEFIEAERSRFQRTCDKVIETLGDRPFNPATPLNRSVFDAVFVAFAKHVDAVPQDISRRYSDLRQNLEFQDYSSRGTTDVDTVGRRLELTERLLFM